MRAARLLTFKNADQEPVMIELPDTGQFSFLQVFAVSLASSTLAAITAVMWFAM